MLKAIFNWFTGKPAPAAEAPRVPETVAPYKVETPTVEPVAVAPAPQPAKCGCGRSASGLCVGLHKLTAQEWAAHPDNPVKPVAEQKAPARAQKKPAAKKAPAAQKTAAITAAPKKPRAKKEAK
jgi:hypothetical protein